MISKFTILILYDKNAVLKKKHAPVQLILVIIRRKKIEYANKFSTLIPIKPLGLIFYGLCFLGFNGFAIECMRKEINEMI